MSEEPSRVTHLRLRNSTILTCHKLMELQQGESDIPMSTMLAETLEGLADKLIASGKLPRIDDLAAGTVLDAIYKKQDDTDLEPEQDILEPDLMEDFLSDVDVSDEVIKDNLSLHDTPLDKEFQKRSPDEQQEVAELIDYPTTPPWLSKDVKPWDEIRLLAPKDILIENVAANYTENIHLMRAVQIVYSTIPQDMWGSPKAQALIAEVMPTVIHYLGPIPEEATPNGDL